MTHTVCGESARVHQILVSSHVGGCCHAEPDMYWLPPPPDAQGLTLLQPWIIHTSFSSCRVLDCGASMSLVSSLLILWLCHRSHLPHLVAFFLSPCSFPLSLSVFIMLNPLRHKHLVFLITLVATLIVFVHPSNS